MEPGEYDHQAVETAVRALWEAGDVYRYARAGDKGYGPVFSVDTPPPYVSAAHLHVGHAMSYSQPDFIVRYRRMRGGRVFFPIGFDDNGLPTERYVEQAYGVRAADMPRADFVALCLAETRRTAERYEDLWRRLGLSVDWSLRYSTIDTRCRRTAQTGFIKLHEAGYLRRAADPILWCPEDRTSLAQADVEDLERTSRLHTIRFGGGRYLEIATTRPELLPACVALYHHPSDTRYTGLKTARVPLFDYEVPVLTDEDVNPEYGTGLMMVCTFGDSEDVARWRRDQLMLRLVVEPDGRLGPLAGQFAGQPVTQARSAIVKALASAGLLAGSVPVRQVVGVHERCQTPVEFQIRPQWFIAVRENADRFRARAAELEWIPPFMRRRLEDWIDGLKWDWNITRQRRYGVPFPVWFCASCSSPVLARLEDLPVDPLTDKPPVMSCPSCGGGELAGDPDVMDTWMTSSLTPQVNDGWAVGGTDPALAPMSMRVQAFEIIRTWLFYSVVQSELLFDRVPWRTALISGWGLSEQGKKLSKRDLDRSTGPDGYNRYVPDDVMTKYGADALRLWATRGRIGTDLRYNEKDVRTGRKFTVKLWNVGRFLSMNLAGFDPAGARPVPPEERDLVDRWVLSHLADTVNQATEAFEAHDYMQAHQAASRMFWSIYCDRYIEMVKDRAGRASARWTLWESYRVLLGLFAPFAPFVTEHMYQRFYRDHEDAASLHLTRWPVADPRWSCDRTAVDQLAVILDATRVLRSGLRLGNSARLSELILQARGPQAEVLLGQIAEPLRVAARADAVILGPAAHPSGVDGVTVDIKPGLEPDRRRDLRHARVAKSLRRAADLRHNDVVKNVRSAEGPSAPTRGQVARLILELGPSTAATLGGRLGLTPAAIRRHLDNLLAEGLIETRTARTYGNRGRGRPAKVFVITDAGRSAFEHAYDDLATSALRFLAERAGPEAIAEFARAQVADLERRYAPVVAHPELATRVQALAEALSADGYAASAGPAPAIGGLIEGPAGEQLCQHHCPVAHVAAEFPQLCEAETEAFGRLLGTPVQRLATIAHGDGICTTHVTGQPIGKAGSGKSSTATAVVQKGFSRPATSGRAMTTSLQSPEGS